MTPHQDATQNEAAQANPDEYNGWHNYPTWCVNLWIENEEPTYRQAREMTREARRDAPDAPQVSSGVWTRDQAARFNLADAIEAWVEDELAPDLGASFASDLQGWALEQVKWIEIADAWLAALEEDA